MSQNQGPGWDQPPAGQAPGQPPAGQAPDQPPSYGQAPPGQPQPPYGQAPAGQQPPTQQPPTQQPPQWTPPPPPTQSGWPTKYCPACGSTIDARAESCPRCGVAQHGVVAGEGKNRAGAALLALLLGSFGIHRFYLGDMVWGLVYLVFFWTGIPGFIAFFEAIYFLTRSDAEWAEKYGGPVRAANGLGLGCAWILVALSVISIVSTIVLVMSVV